MVAFSFQHTLVDSLSFMMQKTCIAPGFALEADGESSIDGCVSGWFAAALRHFGGTTGLGIVELVENNAMGRGGEVPGCSLLH